ncbi:MAG: hypothetical protein FWC09_08095, partial [Lachnospiraceae bacterium]|nr:hypothetical protein [Lachnospiraceae bacterium]
VAKNEFYQSIILLPAGISFEVLESMSTDEIVGIMNAIVEAAGFTLAELFASMVNNMMALVTLVAPILFIMRVKSEEKAARSELIMATPTSRLKYFAGFTGIAFVSVVLLQFVLALGLYSMAQSTIPDVLSFGFLFEAAMVYIPALWAITAITVFLVGAMPKLTGIVWGYYGYSFLVVFIGRMEIFPSWLAYTTPLGFVPQLPMDETNYLTLTLLTVFALVVTAVGFFFYRQRDLNTVTH